MNEGRCLKFDGEDEKILNIVHDPFFGGVGIGNVGDPTLVGHILQPYNRIWQLYKTFSHWYVGLLS